jgi:hypothetical protein
MNERLERALVVLIALHSVGVGVTLLFLTEWGLRLGGWTDVHPLFFARQAGIFHFVVATGYLIEYFRYRGVVLLVTTKSFAVVFLVAMSLVENVPWLVPASAVADGLMGLVVFFVHSRVAAAGREP